VHSKQHLHQFFVAIGTSLLNSYLATVGGYTERTTEHMTNNFLLLRLFTAMGAHLLRYCLAMKRGIHLPEHLPSKDRSGGHGHADTRGHTGTHGHARTHAHTHTHTHTHTLMGRIYEVCHWDEFRCRDTHTMFHKNWFSHSKVSIGGLIDTSTAWRLHKSSLGKLLNMLWSITCTI
jgi:hypothetical protein